MIISRIRYNVNKRYFILILKGPVYYFQATRFIKRTYFPIENCINPDKADNLIKRCAF